MIPIAIGSVQNNQSKSSEIRVISVPKDLFIHIVKKLFRRGAQRKHRVKQRKIAKISFIYLEKLVSKNQRKSAEIIVICVPKDLFNHIVKKLFRRGVQRKHRVTQSKIA